MFLFLVGDFLIYCCWINIMKNFQRKYKKVGLSNKKVKRVFNVHTQNAFIVSWILFCCKRIRDCQIFYFGKVTLQIADYKKWIKELCVVPYQEKTEKKTFISVVSFIWYRTIRCSVSKLNWKKTFISVVSFFSDGVGSVLSYTVFVPLHPFLSSLKWENNWSTFIFIFIS